MAHAFGSPCRRGNLKEGFLFIRAFMNFGSVIDITSTQLATLLSLLSCAVQSPHTRR